MHFWGTIFLNQGCRCLSRTWLSNSFYKHITNKYIKINISGNCYLRSSILWLPACKNDFKARLTYLSNATYKRGGGVMWRRYKRSGCIHKYTGKQRYQFYCNQVRKYKETSKIIINGTFILSKAMIVSFWHKFNFYSKNMHYNYKS